MHIDESALSPRLVAECRRFTRLLTRTEPSAYVVASYVRLRATGVLSARRADALVERGLLAAARQGGLPLRIADVYARFFLPQALLRRRLLLMLAILENSPGSAAYLNSSIVGSVPRVLVGVVVAGTASVACVVVGILCFAPLHVMSLALTRRAGVNS